MYKFTIILPVRNGGELLKKCMASLLGQSYKEYNIVVLDNNSSDGTFEWVESLADKKITIIKSATDLSIEDNWSRIKEVPKNEFVTIIGHDDLLDPDYLQVMEGLIEENPDASLFQTHYRFINANGEIIRTCKPMANRYTAASFLAAQILGTFESMGTGFMFRSKDYDRVGGISSIYPQLIFADYELWMKLISLGFLACSDKECFSYRLHSSTSAVTNGEQYQKAFEKYILFLGSVQQSDIQIKNVINELGIKFMYDNCENLSHRLLKTDLSKRKTSVGQFIKKCIRLSENLMPEKSFVPLRRPGIFLALLLDNGIGRRLFFLLKRKKY